MLSVRPLQEADTHALADYWAFSPRAFLVGMGVDFKKLPSREVILHNLLGQLQTPLEQRNAYCLIWELDGYPVGHCNTNPTHFGDYAHIHLHLWKPGSRLKGMGTEFVKMSLPHFFHDLQLHTLISEPYALNPAPNRTLEKVGFQFVREYTTLPGSINFEQPVKRWEMTKEQFEKGTD